MWKLRLTDLDYGSAEEKAVLSVLRSRWLTMGPKTAEFERRFSGLCGSEHAVAVSNGTAALHLSLLAAGVGPGDEVILPALTFVATANAVLYCGATPVFGDICGPEDLLLDPEDVERKITSRTKVLLPVHYGGYPCDMGAFRDLAHRHGLRIVEDAAHAPGARWQGKPVGSLGDAACFSFFSNKNLVTGEGGMVTTNDRRVAAFVRSARCHGMTTSSHERHLGQASVYDVMDSGYNYRLTEIESALGLVQLEKLEANNRVRRSLVRKYRARLGTNPDVSIPFVDREEESACHILPVLLPAGADRERVRSAMKARGIETSIHYPPVHRLSSFRHDYEASVPRVEQVAGRLLTLPLHPGMSADDVHEVCRGLEESLP